VQIKLARKVIAGGLLPVFMLTFLCIAVSWASQEKAELVKVTPSHFRLVLNDFLMKFQSNYPEKPPFTPEKGEFETSAEYEARMNIWENDYDRAIADYREKFSTTAPVFELHDQEFTFGRYNADKGCFGNLESSRFKVADLNPQCDGHEIDASCYYGPLERYARIAINNICIKREKAKELKAVTFKLRMRVGFKVIPPYPTEVRGPLKLFFHHVSIYDKTTGETLYTITDLPLIGITHGE
jgi:hypothetical protein